MGRIILNNIRNKASNSTNSKIKKIRGNDFYGTPKYIQTVYTAFAIIFVAAFALWWFHPSHIPSNFIGGFRIFDLLLFLLVSYVIWHPIIMDVLTWAIASHIKDLRRQKAPRGKKVAFITTIVPASESLDLLHKCLPAMVKANYEHDTWLLDEGDNPEVRKICEKYGVYHFSRKNLSRFNSYKGKFTKTKGGNHNSWYEMYGDRYDFVAQIDTDFVPKRNFLTETLGYFKDPQVAFVGTPQVYGNTDESIIAKGAAEQLCTFYGSVLKGLSNMDTTLLIGANHVIRVAALKSVNHYSAHITEDLITGMKLHSEGWKSVYLSKPLAIGEGPATWEAYFSQQMRWAYGCMDIFLRFSPKLFFKMGLRRAIYYFFLQQHYFSGIAMSLSVVLLSLYFFADLRAADIDLYKFFGFYSLTLLVCWLMSVYLQRFNVYRKREGEVLLSGKIISIAAWPVWFLAFATVVIGKRLNYKVTPKGESGTKSKSSLGVFIPHFVLGSISVVNLSSSFFTGRQNMGMIFWTVSSALLMFAVPFSQEIYDAYQKSYIKFISFLRKTRKIGRSINRKISFELFPTRRQAFFQTIAPTTQRNGILGDSIFLVFIVALSFVPYIGRIGFYSDDWSFLGNFSLSYDQSLLGLFLTATTPNTVMRPVQNFYEAILYFMFGLEPLGYQIVNMSIFIFIAITFYLVLRQIKIPRIISISIPLVFILLPNYSTDRFWFAVHQANLSILFYFISLLSALKAVSKTVRRKFLWKILSIATLVLSILSYEVIVPLFFINIFILWNPFNFINGKLKTKKASSPVVFISLILIAFLYAVLFKAITSQRLGVDLNLHYIYEVLVSALRVNYIQWGLELPHIWVQIISFYSKPYLMLLSFSIYFLVFWYLYFIFRKGFQLPSSIWLRNITFLSFIIFLSGYLIFFTNNQLGFSPTGVENRIAIASSIGFAITVVGLFGWLSRMFLPEKIAKISFCMLIAILSAGSFLIVNTIASFWAEANQKSENILLSIHEEFPKVNKKSTILLDGVCPYAGPAPIFEAEWDLKGALQTHYLDPTLRADIITPRIKVKDKGISSTIYTFTTTYSYNNLYIYNYKYDQVHKITNAKEARAYFSKFNKDFNNGCPNAEAGDGVAIFNI